MKKFLDFINFNSCVKSTDKYDKLAGEGNLNNVETKLDDSYAKLNFFV
jgi:soluble cytochrome b562